jgi:hypothetical protein
LNNGEKTLFWEDAWVNAIPLKNKFPRLFHLTFDKIVIVNKIKKEGYGVVRVGRLIYGDTLRRWNKLKSLVGNVQLNDAPDGVRWKIGSTGKFCVEDLYLQLRSEGST